MIGTEIELTVLPVEWWRLTVGYTFLEFLKEHAAIMPVGGGGTSNRSQPEHQVVIRSLIDLPMDLELDTSVYWVDGLGAVTPTLRTNNIRQYWRVDTRLGWQATEWLELSLVGQNLNDARHAEYNDVQGNQSTQVPRAGYVMATIELE